MSAWCLFDRIALRPQAIVGGEYVHYGVFLHHICVGRVVVGRAGKYGGHQFECHGKDFDIPSW
jgi:hypothetical protein